MPNLKITQLTADTTPTHDDLLVSVHDPGGTPANRKVTIASLFASLAKMMFAEDAGASDTYTATLSPVPAAYVVGQRYRFKANTANTGAATINFNSLGAKTIKKVQGGITTDLADNDIRAGQWVDLVYDANGNMQMTSQLGNAPTGGLGGLGDVVGPESATDNALVRFDSTTGKLIQGSTITVDDNGAITVPEISAPSTPAAGKVVIYAKTDNKVYRKGEDGVEAELGGGAGSIAPLTIDDANTVSQRNTTNNQTFKVHNTDDGAGNARWIQITYTGSNGEFLSTGTGTTGPQNLVLRVAGGGNGITLTTGLLMPTSDRGLSLGSGSNRWDTITGFDVVSNGGIFRSQNNWDLHGYGAGLMSMSAGGATGGTLRITLGDQGTGTALQRPSGTDYFEIKDGAGTNYKGLRAQFVEPQPVTVANLPASPRHGMLVSVTDSNTTTWGATIAGGGSNKVLAYYNGTNWTVAAI